MRVEREGLRVWWRGEGGGREVLALGYPLMLSQLTYTVQTMVDRLFLSWYAPEAMAGAVAAAFSAWAVIGAFVGTAEYLTAFVAQYIGAGRPERVGAVLWHGLYFSLLAGLCVAPLVPAVPWIFERAGHAPELQHSEIAYGRVMLLGTFPSVAMVSLSTFFAGRGRTRVVLLVNVLTTTINALLDWLWIFDRGGRPGYGAAGAAWATVVAQSVGALCYLGLALRASERRAYGTQRGWRFEPQLFKRMLRFGLPPGLQLSLEIMAFAIFTIVIGRLGVVPLAATGIAFNLNMIVFMPLWGLGHAVSALVARYLGAERPALAARSVYSALAMGSVYMLACGALYVAAPGLLVSPYAAGAHTDFGAVAATTAVLLRFVAFYSIFDMVNVLCAAGLKGAGDTRYPLAVTVVLSWLLLLLPTYVACVRYGLGLHAAWSAATAYVLALGVAMWWRFRRGGWQKLRVIEGAARLPEGAARA